jgi:hypothetical protein
MRFLYYADAAVARRVQAAVGASALLAALEDAGEVQRVLLVEPDGESGAALEATSDPGWPLPVQRAWPHFAMGVSANWLALIREVAAGHDRPPAGDLPALIDHYAAVNGRVTELWQQAGQHAWLHHLNALFGYQPLVFEERRLLRF